MGSTSHAAVNLVGAFRAEFGQGEVARRLAAALCHAEIPYTTVPYDDLPHRQNHPFEDAAREPTHDVNVLCLNAEHLLNLIGGPLGKLLVDRYSIGIWFWETSRFPQYLRPALKFVDEIWVASDFVRSAIAAETRLPVVTFPLPVEIPPPAGVTREELGLPPDGFLFSFVFDFYSTFERKNPDGLIRAYLEAFEPDDGACLAVKSINGDRFPDQLRELRALAAGREDVLIVDGFVPAEHIRGFTSLADCAVSLHRSEGFGLTLAEAMSEGKPAIATGYSGNLEFMDDENSFLVRSAPVELAHDVGPYPAGSVWAEPDFDDAVRIFREVRSNPERTRERAERGRRTILERHSLDRAAEFLHERLRVIDERRRSRPPTSPGREATTFLVDGPRLSWEQPTRLGRAGLLARRLLLRALRPYVVRQRELEHTLVDGLRELELARDQLEERIRKLETEVERQGDGS